MYPDQQKLKLIREAVEEQLAARSLGTRSPEGLFAPIDYTLRLGGKRIRPLLACAAAVAFTEAWQRALPVAVALEIFFMTTSWTALHFAVGKRRSIVAGVTTPRSYRVML